ncbi:MAG TPA: glycosyltransferase family 1 protein [Microscillaceae bacterium]|nr:glycosyltransferase family 1 protein [Microscillaceae bacterium]
MNYQKTNYINAIDVGTRSPEKQRPSASGHYPPMKIGIEAQRIFRPKKHGMDIVALELIRHLQQIDTHNQYYIFVKPDADHTCIPEAPNFEIVAVQGQTYLDWEQIYLPQAMKRTGVELMHFTSNTASLRCSVPKIITLHDVIFMEKMPFKGTNYQKLGWAYRRWIVPKVMNHCAQVFTVSHYEKAQILAKFPHLETKLSVVHNGVAASFTELPAADYQSLHEKIKPKQFLFFLGNEAPKKNMQNVLRGYAQYVENHHSPLPLVIAETVPKQLRDWLTKLRLSWLANYIVLPCYIPNHQIGQWYNQAAAFLYPSLRESFGLPILEAMACGTPVITSNTSAMPEVANDAALLVDPHQPHEIAQAIQQVTNDKSLAAGLRDKGLINSQQFTWVHHAQKVQQAYKALVRPEAH